MGWNNVDLNSYIVETHLQHGGTPVGDYEADCECATQKHLDSRDAVSYAHERVNELRMNGYKQINHSFSPYYNILEWELVADKGSITTVAVVEGDWTAHPLHGEYSKT